jgi:hypothetical protein
MSSFDHWSAINQRTGSAVGPFSDTTGLCASGYAVTSWCKVSVRMYVHMSVYSTLRSTKSSKRHLKILVLPHTKRRMHRDQLVNAVYGYSCNAAQRSAAQSADVSNVQASDIYVDTAQRWLVRSFGMWHHVVHWRLGERYCLPELVGFRTCPSSGILKKIKNITFRKLDLFPPWGK